MRGETRLLDMLRDPRYLLPFAVLVGVILVSAALGHGHSAAANTAARPVPTATEARPATLRHTDTPPVDAMESSPLTSNAYRRQAELRRHRTVSLPNRSLLVASQQSRDVLSMT